MQLLESSVCVGRVNAFLGDSAKPGLSGSSEKEKTLLKLYPGTVFIADSG